jgi:anti-sigma B factor antagonist
MDLKTSKLGNIQIIELEGKFDIECVEDFETAFQKMVDYSTVPQIAVNMNKLDYIDSSGIGSLIKSLHSVKNQKGILILYGLKPMIMNVFKLAKLDMFFQVMTDADFKKKYQTGENTAI